MPSRRGSTRRKKAHKIPLLFTDSHAGDLNMRKTSKGSVRKYEVNCSAWLDLLGYGAQLNKIKYDFTNVGGDEVIKRLQDFHSIVAKKSHRNFRSLTINDGSAFFKDLSPNINSVTWDFISRCVDVFESVKKSELDSNNPGTRMVICAGFRARNENRSRSRNVGLEENILEKLKLGEISPVQAVKQAMQAPRYHDVVPEIQSNMAFAKAYNAESAGSSAGFKHNRCYIELSLFDSDIPTWIVFSDTVNWKFGDSLVEFGELDSIDHAGCNKVNASGVLSAWEVAKRISGNLGIEKKLRKYTKKDNIRNTVN